MTFLCSGVDFKNV